MLIRGVRVSNPESRASFKIYLRPENISSDSKKLGRKVLSPPFLKGDLGGLASDYLIPLSLFSTEGVIPPRFTLIWLI